MKKLLLIITLCFFIQNVFCQGTYIVALQNVYNEFKATINKENSDKEKAGAKALKQIKKIQKPFPTWCDASYYSAKVYETMGEYEKALSELDGCTPSERMLSEIIERNELKGSILYMQKKYDLSIDALKKAQAAYDLSSHTYLTVYRYGSSIRLRYELMNDYENALKYAYLTDTFYGLKKNYVDTYKAKLKEKNIVVKWEELFNVAREYEKAGNNSAAYDKYTEAIKLNELYPDAYYYRGVLGLKMKKYAEAKKDLNYCHNYLTYQLPQLTFLVYISFEATGNFDDSYYSFYDKYPASDRINLLKEYGITPSSKFVSKEIRAAETARINARYEEEQRNRRSVEPSVGVVTQPKPETVCVCTKCGGSGKISFKTFKTWEISNGTDKYGNAKTIKQSGYVNEEQTCTRCLGSGKCK